ncbi:hypothetical protein BD413DRAFT_612127 [Trametes elegans]|nr:hypothetical protein BD413DRAFT_612127 [Trametes elegans]
MNSCSEVGKFLLTYVILKLRLIKGKCILFVNDVDRCYRLKLFLEQFSIKSCVLNSELPLNSRYHTVQEFNKGVYDYIIASDEGTGRVEQDPDDDQEEDVSENEGDFMDTQRGANEDTLQTADAESGNPPPNPLKRKKRASSPAPDASTSKNKSNKRKRRKGGNDADVGRTARAGRTGMSLSFVVPKEQWGKNKVVGCVESAKRDEEVFARIEKEQAARGSQIKDYKFDMKQVEAFRYRMEDALRAVTRSAIKEARIKELKTEILNSDKLKAHFEDNPLDLEYLRHDKPLHPTRVQPHMKHIPKYLLPRIAPVPGAETSVVADEGAVAPKSGEVGFGGGGGRGGKKKSDPLKKFG